MAANYWTSTQRRFWLFTKDSLADMREENEASDRTIVQQYPLPDHRLINIFVKECFIRLSKRLVTRQQVFATALIYIHRYLLSVPIHTVNVYLLLCTAFYLASKTEESPHHIRLVIAEARGLWPDFIPSDVSRLGEMEFSLISELRSQLIIWHPYRTLMEMKENSKLGLATEEVNLAWSIINDSYMTDLPLTCPPHVIAFVAIFLAVVFQPPKTTLGMNSMPQPQSHPSSGAPSPFNSLGGRTGIADSLSHSMSNMSSSQSSSAQSSQGSRMSNGGNGDPNVKAKAMQTAFASEKTQRVVRLLADSEIDLEQMVEATQEIISLYELWEQYSEKTVKEALARYIKGRGLDK